MPIRIDLNDLAERESVRVEWKESVADPEDVVRTLVAFANDLSNLGGGYVVCGARETRDAYGFQRMEAVGLPAGRLREVEGRVLSACRERVSPPLAPIVEELPGADPSLRVLVFVMPSSEAAHALRAADQGSRYYVRIGRETREARNGLLLQVLSRRGITRSWDRRHPPDATEADLDLLALRDTLLRVHAWDPERPVERILSSENVLSAFVPAFCTKEPLTQVLRPRNFALLLFGRAPQRFYPEAHLIVSVYPGEDRTSPLSRRHEIGGTLIAQANRALELLQGEAHQVIDKSDMQHPNRMRYPMRALQEALINALAHRDYEDHHPSRVSIFADRVEIWSSGGLDRRVQPEELRDGRAMPAWRNQALAWFFNRLDLAQGEGQGVAQIIRSMQQNGNPPPEFNLTEASVHVVLRAHPGTTAPRR